ncbi:hypothetical protein [Paraburkholderia kururiensis]|nr:hypothetical protein [Paraburkholderia kururiensis]
MHRIASDNDLLAMASRERRHARMARVWAYVTFAGVGVLWYATVFLAS